MFFLQFRQELRKLFGKKRTYIGFGAFLLAQNAIILMFRFGHATRGMRQMLENAGYPVEPFISALTIATIVVLPIGVLLLPLYAALVGGDLVAKEAEDGTLRMILARPVSRLRLLTLKWCAGALFSALLAFFLGGFGLLFARLWFPWGGLFVALPGEVRIFSLFDAGDGFVHYLGAHLLLAATTATITSLAFVFSCFNMKPAAATILALSVLFANMVLMNIPWFADYKEWFLTYHLGAWQWVFLQPVPWTRLAESLSLLAGFNATFFAIGAAAFQVRDLKS
jgi:ABC-2 type transport system permease protein